MKAVELKNASKRFGDVQAADDISFEVARGQTVSLLGPSGSGKTTILRMIAGFEEPDRGQVFIAGKDMRGKRPYERNVGLLFQDYALFPHMTVEQNIAYGMRRRGMDSKTIPRRTMEMLNLVKLVGLEKRQPNQLSGGQQQRVALARALATEPEVLLLDEPLSALDAKLRQELRIELKEILSSVKSTTIVVTHDQEEAMSLAEHVIVQNQGRIMQRGTPAEIYTKPSSKFVAEFVGRSNWFSGQLGAEVSHGIREFKTEEGLNLWVPDPGKAPHHEYEICVRQERLTVIRGTPPQSLGTERRTNVIGGTIVEAAHLVADVHVIVETKSGRRIAAIEKSTGQPLNTKGDMVTLTFDCTDCIVIPIG